ncbi:MAG: 5'-nucleotidase SurE [Chlamydiales bacterium]|nr:5'-nucleotidase SurE [Chlamydiales bacterium]MCH9620312.1 5'-nucleotidase SurE [Chlamydiales bacterium]MCH9622777.1 5'-nucleotidase SurE [Chlamydiales bacterium]
MEEKPLILLTNDDGIFAPGIHHLWKTLKEADLGELVIIAPASEQSGTGVSITWDRPLHVQKVAWEDDTPAWTIDGTPADCIKMGSRVILKRHPDFIISGINAGSNAGRNVFYSGTVGAVIEGAMRNIPGVAFSCEDGDTPNFHVAVKYLVSVVRYLFKNPLPKGSFLNVNFPHAAQDEVKGFRLTRQGEGRWVENPYLHLEGKTGSSYWMGGKPEEKVEEEECDIAYLRKGYMTAVPLYIHDLTDRAELEKREQSFENLLNAQQSVVRNS